MASAIQIADGIIVTTTLVWLSRIFSLARRSKGLPYPPGPKPLPIVGNLFDIPSQVSLLWTKASEWSKEYGKVVFVQMFGQRVIFLNSYDEAVKVLDKRSATCSSRPTSVMRNDLQDWNWTFSNMPYGERWNRARTVFRKHMDSQAIVNYQDTQTQNARKLLASLLDKSDKRDCYHDIRTCIGSTIMMVVYGHEISLEDDPYVALAEAAVASASSATPGKYLVDTFPWLKYVPEWMPGAGFQADAREGLKLSHAVRDNLYKATKAKTLAGTAKPCITTEMIEELRGSNERNLDEDLVAGVTAVTYLAAIDTSVAVLYTFVLVMMLHPEVQRLAQEEIDRIVGVDRLPTFEDRQNLPYVEAVYKECLRWQTVAPLGVPHACSEDDHSQGYFIPEGTMLIANQWLMMRDPVDYPEPEVFRPERFLPKSGEAPARDPSQILFGFGRRICPGQHLARNSIFITMVSILSTFTISKVEGAAPFKDARGDFIEAFVRRPAPFECNFVPRSFERIDLINDLREPQY